MLIGNTIRVLEKMGDGLAGYAHTPFSSHRGSFAIAAMLTYNVVEVYVIPSAVLP